MKSKLRHILLAVYLAIFTPAGILMSFSQEVSGGSPNFDSYEPEVDLERERVMYSPGEGSDPVKVTSSTPTVKESKDSASTSTRNPVQKTVKVPAEPPKGTNKTPKGEDDSILSFNFLYYLIEKYKLQDIVD